MGLFDYLPPDDDDLDNHHPVCNCGCGELADECMGWWYRKQGLTLPRDSDRL